MIIRNSRIRRRGEARAAEKSAAEYKASMKALGNAAGWERRASAYTTGSRGARPVIKENRDGVPFYYKGPEGREIAQPWQNFYLIAVDKDSPKDSVEIGKGHLRVKESE